MDVFVICWLCSLISMVVIDQRIGARARLVNAWSVVQRLQGKAPSVGDSVVYRATGMVGELLSVLLVTIVSGAFIAGVLHSVL